MATNFSSGSAEGIRNSVPGPFQTGGQLKVQDVRTSVSRSSFTQPDGQKFTNDVARVELTNVQLPSGTLLPKAGFWLVRTLENSTRLLQFRPSLDSSLREVSGFSEDLTFILTSDGLVQTPSSSTVVGAARELVSSVIASGASLMPTSAVVDSSSTSLDKQSIVETLNSIRAGVLAVPDHYFNGLRKINAQWIGISVAMFVDSVSDPAVRLRYRPVGGKANEIATWDDADLRAFVARAHALGFKTYLTLAFEQPDGDMQGSAVPGDPRCRRADAPIPRFVMGKPFVEAGETMMQCLDPADFWWAPDHPQHVAKRAVFWNTYTDIAVKYARLSQEMGVELYSIGTETDWLFRARPTATLPVHFGTELNRMMAGVRSAYSGRVTYDQEIKVLMQPAGFRGGEWAPMLAGDLGFDVIGISAYPNTLEKMPIPTRVMSVAELEQAYWQPVFDNTLIPLRTRYPNLPIVFTEYGLVNDIGVPVNQQNNVGRPLTGRDSTGISDGMRQQANLYQAFFNVNERNNRLVAGGFVWADYMLNGPTQMVHCRDVTHHILCSPPAMSAIGASYAQQNSDSTRVLNWAEHALPTFLPSIGTQVRINNVDCRSYSSTGNYLCIRDGRVLAHNGREWQMLDVGGVADFLPLAKAAGF
ncbi:hypothetical protein [Acidovorax sp.]|uniref:hypothetical protein n=1 Tax=Acidovorax sp. TaxID=1872122 RepID=UPI00391F62A5